MQERVRTIDSGLFATSLLRPLVYTAFPRTHEGKRLGNKLTFLMLIVTGA